MKTFCSDLVGGYLDAYTSNKSPSSTHKIVVLGEQIKDSEISGRDCPKVVGIRGPRRVFPQPVFIPLPSPIVIHPNFYNMD